jgi:hypothetical protein
LPLIAAPCWLRNANPRRILTRPQSCYIRASVAGDINRWALSKPDFQAGFAKRLCKPDFPGFA